MKPSFFSFFFLLAFVTAAQTTIKGVVQDTRGNPLNGISISIKNSYDGTTSDSTGSFYFTTTETGDLLLVSSAIGYKPSEQKITPDRGITPLLIVLKEEVTELKAVVISAGSFEAGDRKKGTVLSSIDMLTTASANADVTGAVKTLPGAQQVGESEGLFVRGGTAAETKTFIDGSLVNNFFYSSVPNVAQRGRFSPWIFKGTIFSTGGYSALYGQALSSALILESIDLPEQSEGNVGLTVLSISAGYQNLAKNKKSSWGISYGYTNLSLAFAAIKQRQQFTKTPVYQNGDANFRIKTSATGLLKYYGYLSTNKLAFTEPSIDTLGYKDAFSLANTNYYHNLSFKESLGDGWKLLLGSSYSNNKDNIEGHLKNDEEEKEIVAKLENKNFVMDNKSHYINGKVVLEKKLQGLSALRFGSEYNYSNENAKYIAYDGNQYRKPLMQSIKALFGETDIYLTNNVAAKIGTRFEHSSLLNRSVVAPRISLAYQMGKGSQAALAYGIFYQNPENRYVGTEALRFSKATHYIAQYQKAANKRILRAELFFKKYNDLIKTNFQAGREVAMNNAGFGDAKGFEVFWRDKTTIKQFDYWVSYSYLDTKRDFASYPTSLRPSFAAKHTGSVVVKKFVTGLKTQFNGSYTYASGRPYYFMKYNTTTEKVSIEDAGKTKSFSSASVSVNYLPNVFKPGAGKFTVFVFSVTNVMNRDNIYGYRYSFNGFRKEAIRPPSKMFVFLGAFISFGVDRSQDVINSNL